MIPHFAKIVGVARSEEDFVLTPTAQSILRILRSEWEMGTRDLRRASGTTERRTFSNAWDELQRSFKVYPLRSSLQVQLTYIWTVTEVRFRDELKTKPSREDALTEIARAYLAGAGMTAVASPRVTGLSKPAAGLGNWALVDEGFAQRVESRSLSTHGSRES